MLAFTGISVLVALVVTLLSFLYMRQILLGHIETQLERQAVRIMGQIDMTLFERSANVATWSRLQVMKDLRTRDLDKRLSALLRDLHQGYGGVYQVLLATDTKGEVLASSDPRWIGRHLIPHDPIVHFHFGRQAIEVMPLGLFGGGLAFQSDIEAEDGERLGKLYAVLNLAELRRLLEQVGGDAAASQVAVLLDRDGRVVAVSSALRGKVTAGTPWGEIWQAMKKNGIQVYRLRPLPELAAVVAGEAAGNGYRVFPGLGWRVVLMAPAAEVLAPLNRLWLSLALFFAFALLASVILSYWVARRIARPLAQLTEFTRRYRPDSAIEVPRIEGVLEIKALNRAFGDMIRHLARSRRDLVRASKLAVVGEMAAIMAHEVRTPLGILRSAAEMLRREANLSPAGREMTQFILSETDRLGNLVNTLLDCTRPRPPRFCPCEPKVLFDRVVELLRTKTARKGVDLSVTGELDGILECDPDHLVQVLLNLLLNALQHVSEGGRIELNSRLEEHWWRVWVCDDGPGVAPEMRERIFDPFFTRREGGVGLGLTVVQQIVQAHGGEIEVGESRWGGACFHFRLPRIQGASDE